MKLSNSGRYGRLHFRGRERASSYNANNGQNSRSAALAASATLRVRVSYPAAGWAARTPPRRAIRAAPRSQLTASPARALVDTANVYHADVDTRSSLEIVARARVGASRAIFRDGSIRLDSSIVCVVRPRRLHRGGLMPRVMTTTERAAWSIWHIAASTAIGIAQRL